MLADRCGGISTLAAVEAFVEGGNERGEVGEKCGEVDEGVLVWDGEVVGCMHVDEILV